MKKLIFVHPVDASLKWCNAELVRLTGLRQINKNKIRALKRAVKRIESGKKAQHDN